MSSPTVSSLSTGVQQLYNQGLLNNGLSTSALKSASSSQLSQLANSSIQNQQTATLLGLSSNTSDTANLSATATDALIQEINPTSTSSTTTTDPLTAAVNASVNAAASRYLSHGQSTGTQVNEVG